MAKTKKAKDKLPSFKDVVLKRMFWLNAKAQPLPGKAPPWSLGGRNIDWAVADYALSCIDDAPINESMAHLELPHKHATENLPKHLYYLRTYFLMADYVIRHEDEEPDCQWDEDDNDIDSSHPFLIMRSVEAAYRMGYIEGKKAVSAAKTSENDHGP
jgi:hypothetical protein